MIMEYKLVREYDPYALTERVNGLIREGFQPYGGVHVVCRQQSYTKYLPGEGMGMNTIPGEELSFVQAMVLVAPGSHDDILAVEDIPT